MKKNIMLLVLTLMLTSLFTACGTKDDNDDTGNKTGTENQSNEDDAGNQDDENEGDTGNTDDDKTIIVGTEAGFAPYEYMVGDQVVGIDMDIAQAIADHLGKELVIKNMDFDGALLAVQNGLVDFVAAGVSVDEGRQRVMDFSIDYVNSTEVVVVNKENPAVSGVDDLAGKVIGVQQGNIADFWVEENAEAKDIKRYAQFAQAAEDLKNKRIDCMVMDKYPAEELVKTNPDLTILEEDLFEDKYAIAVKKGNTELLNEINTVIQKLIDEGKIEEFTKNHTSK